MLACRVQQSATPPTTPPSASREGAPSGFGPTGYVAPSGASPSPLFGPPGAWSPAGSTVSPSPYAGFWIRTLAAIVDLVPVIAVMGVLQAIGVPLGLSRGTGDGTLDTGGTVLRPTHALTVSVTSLVPLLVICAYLAVQWILTGTTPGQRLVGLRIVRAADGARMSPAQGVVRAVGLLLSVLPLGLGLIWAAADGRKQGWHDRMAGTVVLRR